MNVDRRQKPRINDRIAVSVRGSEGRGTAYRFDTIARDIGAGGLCAFAPRVMKEREKISLRIRFALAGSKPFQAPTVVARAVVLRVEQGPDHSCLFAVSFLLRRIIESKKDQLS